MLRILFTIILFGFFFSSYSQGDWKEAKEKDGILIYTRTAKNKDLKEFKAHMSLEVSLDAVAAILTDAKNYPNWVYKLSTAEVLKGTIPGGVWSYYTVDMPWPLSDRDGVSSTRARQEANGKIIITQKSEPNFIGEKEDMVRLLYIDTTWQLEKGEDGKVHITYQSLADPGGLPSWLVNLFLLDGPFETLQGLRKESKKAAFAKANLSWIQK